MSNKIGIFGKTVKQSNDFLEWLVYHISAYKEDIEIDHIIPYGRKIQLKNGDLYISLPSTNYSRGYKFNQIFIEIGTDLIFIDCVAIPLIISSDIPEEDRVIYFYNYLKEYRFYKPLDRMGLK